jgi:imidazolonepropionase-like amidohydrolase
MMRTVATLLCLLLLSDSAVSQTRSGASIPLVITGGTVIDTRTGAQARDTTIIIEGDRITRVGRRRDVRVPADAQLVQAKGRWIIPGLIDMHVHIATVQDIPLELFIANGVTAVRDMGGSITRLRLLREEVEAQSRLGPRIFFAGMILDGNPPLPAAGASVIVDTPERAVSAVHFMADQAADVTKVYNGISEPVFEAIVRTARERGLPVAGHVPRVLTVSRAIELGMNGIEHSPIRSRDLQAWGVLSAADAASISSLKSVTQREALVWDRVDLQSPQVRDLLAQLVRSGVTLDPTLSTDEYDTLFLYEQEASHPNNRYLKRSFVEINLGSAHEVFRVPAELQSVAAAGLLKRRQFVGMCQARGVRIVAGTDGPSIGRLAAGFGLHRELALLVEAGLSPLQALRAATLEAAHALQKAGEWGTIEAGKRADLVVLQANPLDDIHNTTTIDAVVVRGQILKRVALDQILSGLEADARAQPGA